MLTIRLFGLLFDANIFLICQKQEIEIEIKSVTSRLKNRYPLQKDQNPNIWEGSGPVPLLSANGNIKTTYLKFFFDNTSIF